MKFAVVILIFTFCLTSPIAAQSENLTNAMVVEMSKVGLDKQIILKKISDTDGIYEVTAAALIELKKAGVADEVIALMIEKAGANKDKTEPKTETPTGFSENVPGAEAQQFTPAVVTPKEALARARTVAIEKSSLNPSRQGLEKALMKRKDWQKYNLTLVRYKQDADIYIEIGRVPLSWITHRYVFRIYDRRSGTIITAGETTSWGSLSENMAREITQKLKAVEAK